MTKCLIMQTNNCLMHLKKKRYVQNECSTQHKKKRFTQQETPDIARKETFRTKRNVLEQKNNIITSYPILYCALQMMRCICIV